MSNAANGIQEKLNENNPNGDSKDKQKSKRERKNKAIICLYLFNKMFSFNKIIRLSAFLLLTSEFVIADNLVSQTSTIIKI